MDSNGATPNQILREIFLDRKKRNSAYSTRALARDLGVSQTYVSLILAGKKDIPHETALRFAQQLRLDGQRARDFLAALNQDERPSRRPPAKSIALEEFRVISEWYHLAILDLATTDNFQSDVSWIAKRLGVSRIQARDAITRLVRLGLLEQGEKGMRKAHRLISVPAKQPHQAIRLHHEQMMSKAAEALKDSDERSYALREISSSTMAVNPARVAEARKRIRKFQNDILNYVTEGACTEVYQLNCQFFPLTKSVPQKEKKK